LEITVGGENSLRIWFGVGIRDVFLVFKDGAGNVVPNSILKIESASFCIKDTAPQKLKLSPDNEDRGFHVKPFKVSNGWLLKGTQSKVVLFSVKVERNGKSNTIEKELPAFFMSGLPSTITVEGGFDKLLSREQFIACKLKLLDAWGNPFRGLNQILDAEVAVREQEWLCGNSSDGPLATLTNIIDGTVAVDQKNLSVYLVGKYGMKGSITFICNTVDHRADPAERFPRIEVTQDFEIEDLELQFCVPQSISGKFKTEYSGGCCVIKLDHGSCDIQRKSLFGIFLQIVKRGSTKLFNNSRRDKRIQCERVKIGEGESSTTMDVGEDQDETAEFVLEVTDGKSALIDKYVRTDGSYMYTAKYDELEAQMKILVIAGKPARIKFETVESVEAGCSAEVRFRVMDERDLVVSDLAPYTFDIQPEVQLEGLFVDVSKPVRKQGAVYGFECIVKGCLPADSSSSYSLTLLLNLIERVSAMSRSRHDDMTDSDTDSQPHVVKESINITVHAGQAKTLRLVTLNGHQCDAFSKQEIVTGTKFEYTVQAVDSFGNVDTSCRRRVRLTAKSESPDDKSCSGTGVLAQGETVLLLGPWFARGARGKLILEVNDRSNPRFEPIEYDLRIRAGTWPAELRIVQPAEADVGSVVEMDDTMEQLSKVEAEILAADGSLFTYSRLGLQLSMPNCPSLMPEFLDGRYRFSEITIPREPGVYDLELSVDAPGSVGMSIQSKTLHVRRTFGTARAARITMNPCCSSF
jgi:hypothetical protein